MNPVSGGIIQPAKMPNIFERRANLVIGGNVCICDSLMGSVPGPDPNLDPDPPDPHVFGPPRSGSEVWIRIRILLSALNLFTYCFVTLLVFLSLKNDVNVM